MCIAEITKSRVDNHDSKIDERRRKIADAVRSIIEAIGEDGEREGLKKTPDRFAEAMMFFTQGYEQSLESKPILLSAD